MAGVTASFRATFPAWSLTILRLPTPR